MRLNTINLYCYDCVHYSNDRCFGVPKEVLRTKYVAEDGSHFIYPGVPAVDCRLNNFLCGPTAQYYKARLSKTGRHTSGNESPVDIYHV